MSLGIRAARATAFGGSRTLVIAWGGVQIAVDAGFRADGTLTDLREVRIPALRPDGSADVKLLLDAIWIVESMLADRLNPPRPWDLDDLRASQSKAAKPGPLYAVIDALAEAQREARERVAGAASSESREEEVSG
jgi:hypothetical protein